MEPTTLQSFCCGGLTITVDGPIEAIESTRYVTRYEYLCQVRGARLKSTGKLDTYRCTVGHPACPPEGSTPDDFESYKRAAHAAVSFCYSDGYDLEDVANMNEDGSWSILPLEARTGQYARA